MTMSTKLKNHLNRNGIKYDLVTHPYAASSMQAAEEAHISGDQIAKSVMLEDKQGYLMAVIPATKHVEFGRLNSRLQRNLALATEQELADIFADCDLGAIPPIGAAYGLKVILDDKLMNLDDIFFEAGDHTELVHVSGKEFQKLMAESEHGHITHQI